jgi:hypothetical protein
LSFLSSDTLGWRFSYSGRSESRLSADLDTSRSSLGPANSARSSSGVPQRFREVGDRVVAIVDRQLRGRGSGIYVEDQVGIVYELRDGVATRISGHRDVVEALAEVELDV